MKIAQRRTRCPAHAGAAVPLDVRIDQVEDTVRVRETGGPNPAGIRIAEQVELARARERSTKQSPIHQVARVVDLHAGKPLESRGRDVIIVAHSDNRGIGVKALENGILNHCRSDLGFKG